MKQKPFQYKVVLVGITLLSLFFILPTRSVDAVMNGADEKLIEENCKAKGGTYDSSVCTIYPGGGAQGPPTVIKKDQLACEIANVNPALKIGGKSAVGTLTIRDPDSINATCLQNGKPVTIQQFGSGSTGSKDSAALLGGGAVYPWWGRIFGFQLYSVGG